MYSAFNFASPGHALIATTHSARVYRPSDGASEGTLQRLISESVSRLMVSQITSSNIKLHRTDVKAEYGGVTGLARSLVGVA
jgi:hypothetical protein